jgi:hypothetical protein
MILFLAGFITATVLIYGVSLAMTARIFHEAPKGREIPFTGFVRDPEPDNQPEAQP